MRQEMHDGAPPNPSSLMQLQKLPPGEQAIRRASNDTEAKSVKSTKSTKSSRTAKSEKKKKKSKKKKKKKHKKTVTDKITEGDMDANFDAFTPENFLLGDQSAQRWGTEECNNSSAWADFSATPVTAATSATMRSSDAMTAASRSSKHSDTASIKSKDSGQISSVDGDKLKSYLAENGQDEKMAYATALAFESFLKEQQRKLAHEEGLLSTALSVSQSGSESRASSGQTNDDDFSDDSESDDSYDLQQTRTTGSAPESNQSQESHDFSDVSTLGMYDVADPNASFSGSWADGTWVNGPPSSAPSAYSDGQGDFGRVYRNPTFARGGAPSSTPGGRRVPNRVAAAASAHNYPQSNYGGMSQQRWHSEERSFAEQMASLTIDERGCVNALKARWTKSSRYPLPNMMYLKFARCSPGRPFNFRTAYGSMKKYDFRYMGLGILNMEEQMRRKILFPVEGLKSVEGHDMFYMMPCRYFPKKMSVSSVINNLIYTIDCLMEKEDAQRDGIGFVANMSNWKMTNFQVSYCYKFMMALQGKKTPVRVQYFLIVNPPDWFGSIWNIMKPMLAEDFRKKVHMIPLEALNGYLAPGFQDYLPDEMRFGKNPTDQIIEDFIATRKQVEGARLLSSRSVTTHHTY